MKPSDVRPPKLNCQEKGDKSKLTPEVQRQSPGSKNDNKVVHESPKRKNPNVSKGADGTEAIIFVHKAAVSSCGGRRDLGESLGCGWGLGGSISVLFAGGQDDWRSDPSVQMPVQ